MILFCDASRSIVIHPADIATCAVEAAEAIAGFCHEMSELPAPDVRNRSKPCASFCHLPVRGIGMSIGFSLLLHSTSCLVRRDAPAPQPGAILLTTFFSVWTFLGWSDLIWSVHCRTKQQSPQEIRTLPTVAVLIINWRAPCPSRNSVPASTI